MSCASTGPMEGLPSAGECRTATRAAPVGEASGRGATCEASAGRWDAGAGLGAAPAVAGAAPAALTRRSPARAAAGGTRMARGGPATYGGVGQGDGFGLGAPEEASPRSLSPHALSPVVW